MPIDHERRAVLLSLLGAGSASLIPVALLTGCGSKLTCNDETLSTEDLKNRADNSYMDASIDPKKTCSTCQLFKPAGEKQCGACTIVKGHINPGGNCKNWAAKT